MSKKISVVILATAMCITGLCGCSVKNETTGNIQETETVTKSETVTETEEAANNIDIECFVDKKGGIGYEYTIDTTNNVIKGIVTHLDENDTESKITKNYEVNVDPELTDVIMDAYDQIWSDEEGEFSFNYLFCACLEEVCAHDGKDAEYPEDEGKYLEDINQDGKITVSDLLGTYVKLKNEYCSEQGN